MSIKSQISKAYSKPRDENMLKAQIRALAVEFKDDPETANCWVDCIAIQLDIDNDDYIRKVVSGLL